MLRALRMWCSALITWFRNYFPQTIVRVRGFSIIVKRVEECVLQEKEQRANRPLSKESGRDIPLVDVGSPRYFRVQITYDGTNPDYPGKTEQWTLLLTNELGIGAGVIGNIFFQPAGVRFTKIEIVEVRDDRCEYGPCGDKTPQTVVALIIHTRGGRPPIGRPEQLNLMLMSRPSHFSLTI